MDDNNKTWDVLDEGNDVIANLDDLDEACRLAETVGGAVVVSDGEGEILVDHRPESLEDGS